MFSFGPIHHEKFQSLEHLKLKLASHFIKENNIRKPEDLLQKIMEKLIDLKSCYNQQVLTELESKSVKYSDEGLAWMFFVYGCAIVHFIYCVVMHDAGVEDKTNCLKMLEMKNDQVAFAQHDIFLLENQLPYLLLELIIDSVVLNWQAYSDSIIDFVEMNLMIKGTPKQRTNSQEVKISFITRSPCHLLDLLRLQLLGEEKYEGFCMKILNVLHRLGQMICRKKDEEFQNWWSFRSVNELKATGICLKPCGGISLKIFFQGFFGMGILKLPKLVVDDSTAPILFNLIAYEMCPDFINDFEVISYVCFLHSLIDEPGDVRELRKANIVLNALGSDEDVAKLFNNIAWDLAFNPGIYPDMKNRIENYCNSMATTWMAQFYH